MPKRRELIFAPSFTWMSRSEYVIWVAKVFVLIPILLMIGSEVGFSQSEKFEVTTTTTPPPPPPRSDGRSSPKSPDILSGSRRPAVLNVQLGMGIWSPHAGGSFDFPFFLHVGGKKCIVSVNHSSAYLDNEVGGLIEVARADNGDFVFGLYRTRLDNDCEAFDKAMSQITGDNHAREIYRGDAMPTYTYTSAIDWEKGTSSEKCVWLDQADDGLMRTTLTVFDCSKLTITWEIVQSQKLADAAKLIAKEYIK